MAIEIGTINADTSVKFNTTTIQSGYIGTNYFYGNHFPILDLYPTNIHHAYSLRKLKTSYSGFGLRVRRTAVTSTEVNVGFDSNNQISLTSPITYASGTATTAINLGQFAAIAGYGTADVGVTANQNIFVVTWYDQSGNGKNPTNAFAGQQPRLVSSTTADLERSGGKVAVRFTRASNQNLTLADTTSNTNNMSSYWVGQRVTTAGAQCGYGLGTNRFYFPYSAAGSAVYAGISTNSTAITLENVLNTDRKFYEFLSPTVGSTTLVQGWTNGVAKNTAAILTFTNINIQLGTAATLYFDGYIQEVIGYQSNLNRLEKEKNINGYWTIY